MENEKFFRLFVFDKLKFNLVIFISLLFFLFYWFGVSVLGSVPGTGLNIILFSFFFVSVYSLLAKQVALLFYCVYFSFVVLFPYLWQKAIGVRFFEFGNGVDSVSREAFTVVVVHCYGLLLGAVSYQFLPKKMVGKKHSGSFLSTKVPFVVSVLLILVGALVVGPDIFFGSRKGVEDQFFSSVNSYERFIFYIAKFSPYIILFLVLDKFLGSSKKNNLVVLFLFCFALMVSNPVNTARFVSLTGLFLVGSFLFQRRVGSNFMFYVSVFSPIGLFLVLPMTSMMRMGAGLYSISDALVFFRSLEFSSFQYLMDSIGVFKEKPLGSSYLLTGIFVFFPRSIWTGKESALFDEVSSVSGYVSENIAVPSFFSAYADFGVFGVFVFSVLVGVGLASINFRSSISFYNRRDFYSLLVFCLIPVLVRGSLNLFFVGFYAASISYEILRFWRLFVFGGGR